MSNSSKNYKNIFTKNNSNNIKEIHLKGKEEIDKVMQELAQSMSAFRRSIEYLQDYIDLPGLKMWQDEMNRVFSFNIEQECNRFLKKKIYLFLLQMVKYYLLVHQKHLRI